MRISKNRELMGVSFTVVVNLLVHDICDRSGVRQHQLNARFNAAVPRRVQKDAQYQVSRSIEQVDGVNEQPNLPRERHGSAQRTC